MIRAASPIRMVKALRAVLLGDGVVSCGELACLATVARLRTLRWGR